eukprot:4302901-Pyramimonas_sp.AAC.1
MQKGWKVLGAPAVTSKNGGVSSGVLILVRAHLDAWVPHESQQLLVPFRLCKCYLRHLKLGVVDLYSIYLKDKVGFDDLNLGILRKLGQDIHSMGPPVIVGGGFNTSVIDMIGNADLDKIGMSIKAPSEPTYVSGDIESRIDDFWTSSILTQAFKSVSVDLDTPLPPHRPVKLVLGTGIDEILVNVPGKYQRYPTDPAIGPAPCPPSYSHLKEALDRFIQDHANDGGDIISVPKRDPDEQSRGQGVSDQVYGQ